jgi:hypothetical protein
MNRQKVPEIDAKWPYLATRLKINDRRFSLAAGKEIVSL